MMRYDWMHLQMLAKVAKDCASGAVGIMSIFAAIIGLSIYLPRILKRFDQQGIFIVTELTVDFMNFTTSKFNNIIIENYIWN